MDALRLRRAVESELEGNLLPFWRERSVDRSRGGFIAEMSHDGKSREGAGKGLILNARLLWTFSTLARERHHPRDLELARRAFDYLQTRFRDREHGGYLWRLDSEGRTLVGTKKVYGQAFSIYALSAYYLATGDQASLAAAREVFALIERYAHDDQQGGYLEALAPDWTTASELRLSARDMEAPKSMNTHLHLLEAYAGLYRAWPDASVAARLAELIDLFGSRILGRGRPGHLSPFFTAGWETCSDSYTFGHDIEAAWLLCEAAAVLDDQDRLANVRRWAVDIGYAVLAEGIDTEGGLAYEGRNGSVIDGHREWWCQAEAVVGFWQVYELTGDDRFASAAGGVWDFIARRMVDRAHGEWFWRVRADGTVDDSQPKVSEWKGPYHNTRMCLEMMRRIAAGEEKTTP